MTKKASPRGFGWHDAGTRTSGWNHIGLAPDAQRVFEATVRAVLAGRVEPAGLLARLTAHLLQPQMLKGANHEE